MRIRKVERNAISGLNSKWRERMWKVYSCRNVFGELKGFESPMTFDEFLERVDGLPTVEDGIKARCRG